MNLACHEPDLNLCRPDRAQTLEQLQDGLQQADTRRRFKLIPQAVIAILNRGARSATNLNGLQSQIKVSKRMVDGRQRFWFHGIVQFSYAPVHCVSLILKLRW